VAFIFVLSSCFSGSVFESAMCAYCVVCGDVGCYIKLYFFLNAIRAMHTLEKSYKTKPRIT
jgi:hypothetical protein